MNEKLSISLPAKMVETIKAKVESGAFASTSEVIREAVRVWQRQEDEHTERLAAIRARVERSLADPRPDLSAEEAFARIFEHHESRLKSKKG